MSEVTWFKVLTDIFADDKIKILQSMPEGDALLVMWFKVLAQAGKTNDGGYIYLKKNIPYTPAMLATLFNKPQMLVDLAVRTFEQFDMIDVDDKGYIFVTNWEKHQSIDKLEKIKEKDRIRSANYRERKRQELIENHVTVTLPSQANHATEIELELDIDLIPLPHSDECGEQFKKFWQAYPNKKGKSDAERKFKLYYRDKKMNFTELMEGLERYIAYCAAGNRPYKDGSTFINSRAWEDDWTIKADGARNTTHALPLHTPEMNEAYERALADRTNRNAARGVTRDTDSAS